MKVKIIYSTVVSLLILFQAQAQKTWSYEIFYSIDNLSGDDYIGNPNQVGFFVHYNQNNYTTGLNVRKEVSGSLSMLTGLSFSKQEISKTFSCPVCGFVGDILPFEDDQKYLQVPIGLLWRFFENKLTPVAEGGLLNNVLVAGTTNDIEGSQTAKGYYLGGYLGARIQYDITDQFTSHIGYRYTTSISKVFESDFAFRSNNFSIGLAFTL